MQHLDSKVIRKNVAAIHEAMQKGPYEFIDDLSSSFEAYSAPGYLP